MEEIRTIVAPEVYGSAAEEIYYIGLDEHNSTMLDSGMIRLDGRLPVQNARLAVSANSHR